MSDVRLPGLVKVAVAITLFNSWVIFEETIVNRQGLWRYMPFYRVDDPCVWDLAMALLIAAGVWWALRRPRTQHSP